MVRSALAKSAARMARTLRSCTVASLSAGSSRMASMAASWQSSLMSLAEYPSVARTTCANSLREIRTFWPPSKACRICSLPAPSGRGMWMRLASRRRTASSSSSGRLLAPMTKTCPPPSPPPLLTPSNWMRNSVLRRRLDSFSLALRALSTESISSMKMMAGCRSLAHAKSARTSFSASPTHLEVRVEALMAKKVQVDSVATALASIVLPLPGGPYRSRPRVGARKPLKRSGRVAGRITISRSSCFAFSSPDMSDHATPGDESKISEVIICLNLSSPAFLGSALLPAPPAPAPEARLFAAADADEPPAAARGLKACGLAAPRRTTRPPAPACRFVDPAEASSTFTLSTQLACHPMSSFSDLAASTFSASLAPFPTTPRLSRMTSIAFL
mmetsp:Transcript_9902/g.19979  ORF Transcript_9902/g.19979 Transcript_9902/m.19979 type:complete len:388 (+) Transcript_9902:142-1305(+)